eukprot:m.14293 g.14293  ORF g.14293 m.14293 type:complete len:504 (-) comp5058_c0_seq1:1462-2973(-)
MTQDFFADGVNIFGRLSSLCNACVIAFYVAAFFVPDWSETDRLGIKADDTEAADAVKSGEKFGSLAASARFGLDQFCIETRVPNWGNNLYDACFYYDDDITTCEYNSTSMEMDDCLVMKGCDRVDGVCKARDVVKISLAVGILILVIGGTFSEKTAFLGATQLLGALAGMVAMSFWVNWQNGDGESVAEEKVSLGVGGWVIIGGWLIAFLAAIFTLIDRCCTDASKRHGTMNDGISVLGRVASLGSIVVWVMLILAVANPEWTNIDTLGDAGDFCLSTSNKTVELCQQRSASLGLWVYCVEEDIPYFGTGFTDLCLEWDTKVIVADVGAGSSSFGPAASGNGSTIISTVTLTQNAEDNATEAVCEGSLCMDGNVRFDFAGAEEKRKFSGFATVAGFLAAVIVDIFSEKVRLGAICMFLSGVGSFCAMAAWVALQEKVKKDGGGVGGVKYATGGWLLVGSFLLAWVASLFYCTNIRSALQRDRTNTRERSGTTTSKTNQGSTTV